MSTISSIFPPANSTNATLPAAPQQTLGQADFLKLLVTQMTSQDPLNPQTGQDFIAQMAQFSALQSSQTMQTDLVGLRSDQQLLQANGLLGRTVTLNLDGNTQISGQVSSVQVVAGTPHIVVNGQSYDLSQLSAISPTPAAS